MKKNRGKIPQRNERDQDEILRGKYREVVKENKRLRRQLRSRSLFRELPENEELPDREEFMKITCPRCGGTNTNVLELRGKLYLFCNDDCSYRGPTNEKDSSKD